MNEIVTKTAGLAQHEKDGYNFNCQGDSPLMDGFSSFSFCFACRLSVPSFHASPPLKTGSPGCLTDARGIWFFASIHFSFMLMQLVPLSSVWWKKIFYSLLFPYSSPQTRMNA